MSNIEYIKDNSDFKCTIDGITYDCHIKFEFGSSKSKYLGGNFIRLKVQKYKEVSFLFWKWSEIDFKHIYYASVTNEHIKMIGYSRYFKPELVKTWVEGALRQREREMIQEDASTEEERLIKILKEI